MIGLLAFALIACGVVAVTVIADEETDAADGKVVYDKIFRSNSPETIDFNTNELAFRTDPALGTYEARWFYYDGNAWQEVTYSTQFTIDPWEYTLESKGDGVYTLTINTAETGARTVLHMKCTMMLKQMDQTEKEYTTIEVDVNIYKDGNALPDNVNQDFFHFNLDASITKDEGKIKSYTNKQEVDSTKFKWFAYNLPAGISITGDGYLAGVPKEHEAGNVFKIYAANAFGDIKEYEIGIMVTPKDLSEFYIYKGDAASFNPTDEVLKPKISAVQENDTAYLVISKTTATSTNTIKVTAVGGNEPSHKQILNITSENNKYWFYEVPTNMTGAYGIVIEATKGTTSYIFDTTLYVLPHLSVIAAGIGVSSSSTSGGS